MKKKLSFLMILLLAGAAFAQESQPADGAKEKSPFQPDEALKRLLEGEKAPEKPGDTFQPLPDPPALPEMGLKGIVRLRGREKFAALVDIGGVGTYTVRENDKLSFTLPGRSIAVPNRTDAGGTPSGTANVTTSPNQTATSKSTPSVRTGTGRGVLMREQVPVALKIVHVGPDGVLVEVGTLGEVLIIR